MINPNPWLSVWLHPRKTIAHIVKENPNRSLWLLAAIYGFCSLVNIAQSAMLGKSLNTVALVIIALVLSPFWGYINFMVCSALIKWVGTWLKGQGSFVSIRAAYAWSCVPIALNIPLWALLIVLFGRQLFVNFSDSHVLTSSILLLLFFIMIAKVVLGIWSLVLYLNMLAEVQKFSILRAILNVIIATVILIIIFFILWTLLVMVL